MQRTAKLGDGLIVFLTDVTAQRRMEAELRGYADMVAHDLREPVTGIAHLVTLLERRADEPPSPEVLRLLRDSTERARELIDGVLAYARAGELQRERGGARPRHERGRPPICAPVCEAAGATLEVGDAARGRRRRAPAAPRAAEPRRQRGEVPRRGAARASRSRALRGSEGWVVTVRDNGLGVDPEQAGRIFGMFSRLNGDTEGTGIGLAVCRRVVEAHGGRIWVEPAEGGGSAFRFTLPAAP